MPTKTKNQIMQLILGYIPITLEIVPPGPNLLSNWSSPTIVFNYSVLICDQSIPKIPISCATFANDKIWSAVHSN